MKDYLNSEEKENLIRIAHFTSDLQVTLEFNTLTNQEKGNLKRSFTYANKALVSVFSRLNESALRNYKKSAKKSKMKLDLYGDMEFQLKKKSSDFSAAYEENKEYMKLIELIFDYKCKNCNENSSKCDIYKEFEEQNVPRFDGTKKCRNCKYSWSDD